MAGRSGVGEGERWIIGREGCWRQEFRGALRVAVDRGAGSGARWIAGPWGGCRDLSKRQHAGARFVRPVEGDDGALVEFRFAILKGAEKRGTAYFWYERLPTEEHNTGSIVLRVRENLREIQIVGQDDVYASAGVVADFTILSGVRTDRRPVDHFVSGVLEKMNSTGRQVHIDKEAHQLASRTSCP